MEKCPKLETCPIFQKGILFSEQTGQSYRNLYCLKREKYPVCKRYLVSESGYKVPESIMPNSSLSVEEIIKRINQS